MILTDLAERGLVPDSLVRAGIRHLLKKRLAAETAPDASQREARLLRFMAELDASPIAIETSSANAQHYEVPAEFFRLHLGPRLKYSCCLYPEGRENLAGAEEAMLALCAERAEIVNGQRILDLGCGWGSLSMWLAARFPAAHVVGLSNSHAQREFIMARAGERGLTNLAIVTGNIVDFDFPAEGIAAGFDRIVSIEMFEHMKNYRRLFARLSRWLAEDGRLFVHVFAHRHVAYHFEDKAADDWMSRHFFTGGTMPSFDLFDRFDDDLALVEKWWIPGTQYQRTANHWLAHMDAARAPIMEVFRAAYGARRARLWFRRWRIFYMAVAELFGYAHGTEWGVAHYLFARRAAKSAS